MRLGQKIAALRKKNHLFQEALAEKMNVSRQAVSKWESEQSIPDIEKYCNFIRIIWSDHRLFTQKRLTLF